MKFLIVTNHSFMLWQFRREMIEELLQHGEVVISTPFVGHEEDFEKMGCRCINTELERRGINPVKDLRLYHFYRKLIKSEKPDMVITYSIKPNVYAAFACRLMRIPYCVNVQGLGTAFQKQPIAAFATVMYRAAVKKAKVVFFENDENAHEFIKRRIVSPEKIEILRGAGVNLEIYEKKKYPDDSDGVHFLYLGRIMREKGADELFEVIRRTKKKYGASIRFDLVGFFDDEFGEYPEKVKALVNEDMASFYGFQLDPKPFYEKSHCVVLPSYHEGMSNVLLEAAATGRVVITTDIPGCQEAVDSGINGYLCEKMDVDSLEDCIERFMALDNLERGAMGEAGRIKMEREFEKKSVVKRTIDAVLSGVKEK